MNYQLPYFKINDNTGVACIPKSGSTSIAQSICNKYYPEIALDFKQISKHQHSIESTKYNLSPYSWQIICPKIETPINTVALIREPINRFCSMIKQIGCINSNFNLDETINFIINSLTEDINSFGSLCIEQINWVKENTKLYRFEEHLDIFIKEIGLLNLSHLNNSEQNILSFLTSEQIKQIQQLYKEDIELYNTRCVV